MPLIYGGAESVRYSISLPQITFQTSLSPLITHVDGEEWGEVFTTRRSFNDPGSSVEVERRAGCDFE